MADYPAFPLWTDAYLADTTHLSDAEHGRYLMMLIHMWRMPGQRFPNDDEWMARKFQRTPEQVRSELRPLIAEFFITDGNWIKQKRLAREFAHVRRHSARQSERAKARWRKEKGECHGNAENGNAPTPTPTPIKKDSPSGSPKKAPRGPIGAPLPSEWQPNELEVAYARRLGLAPDRVAENFRDFWLQKTGKDALKADWSATWRMWCRRDAERRQAQARASPDARRRDATRANTSLDDLA